MMEFCYNKRKKKLKKKRRNFINKRGQVKLEVKLYNRKHSGSGIEKIDLVMKKDRLMEAIDFWENYEAAYEWLNKHNSTWWKSRYLALVHENHLLKETIKDLKIQQFHKNITTAHRSKHEYENITVNSKDENGYEYETNIDHSFEFQLNETMMNFLAQSLCHKIELKKKKNGETLNIPQEMDSGKTDPNSNPFIHKRNKDAKLLYCQATSRILAMETALQTTFENHIAKSKPYYWPNIPLKL